MSYKASDIVHETKRHFAIRVPNGFEVYRINAAHSVRCAQIGYKGSEGMTRVLAEIRRRESASAQ